MGLLDKIKSNASKDYVDHVLFHDVSKPIGDFVLIYGLADVVERNETYEVQRYLDGWFAIGDDGAGSAILMKLDGSPEVFRRGHGSIGAMDPELIADSFDAWISNDCPAPWIEDEDE